MTRDIVHVLSGLERGGIETWLVHTLRSSQAVRRRSRLVLLGEPPSERSYAADVREMGIPIHSVPAGKWSVPFARRLAGELRQLRPRIVHAHLNFMGGWVMAAGRLAHVPVRITHYHSVFPVQHQTPLRRTYIRGVRLLERAFATHVLGCSRAAHASYAGPAWQNDPRRRVLYYGIDFSAFDQEVDRAAVRTELGLDVDAPVIGHVGGMHPVKNHARLLDIVVHLAKREPHLRLLLVGDGPRRSAIAERASELGIAERVVWAGMRSDVARLLLGAMDVFVFPSLFEGLGIAVIEAQAAGLPCVISSVVPEEACVVEELVCRLPLAAGVEAWADAVQSQLSRGAAVPQAQALATVNASPFQTELSVAALERLYDQACGETSIDAGLVGEPDGDAVLR